MVHDPLRCETLPLEGEKSFGIKERSTAFFPLNCFAHAHLADLDEVRTGDGHSLEQILDSAMVAAAKEILKLYLQPFHRVWVAEQLLVGLLKRHRQQQLAKKTRVKVPCPTHPVKIRRR